jgi:hypothetical protein
MWIAIVGYGIAFAGMATLAGRQCGIIDAFKGTCSGAGTKTQSATSSTSPTRLLSVQQQSSMIGTTPIPQVA